MTTTVDEVRALLREFVSSDLLELQGKAGDWQFFFGREGAGPNLLAVAQALVLEKVVSSVKSDRIDSITAEHLGLFTSTVSVGGEISEGQQIGSLSVLDRTTPVISSLAGCIVSIAGDGLVEFNSELACVLRPA